jgi:hypothetical protein
MEVLGAAVLLGIGVSAVMGGLSAMLRAEARSQEREVCHRLAADRLEEILGTVSLDNASQSGDFSDRGLSEYKWTAQVAASGVTNLDVVSVTVTAPGADTSQGLTLETLVYVPPQQTTGGTTP